VSNVILYSLWNSSNIATYVAAHETVIVFNFTFVLDPSQLRYQPVKLYPVCSVRSFVGFAQLYSNPLQYVNTFEYNHEPFSFTKLTRYSLSVSEKLPVIVQLPVNKEPHSVFSKPTKRYVLASVFPQVVAVAILCQTVNLFSFIEIESL
jgi:hypothetical protein